MDRHIPSQRSGQQDSAASSPSYHQQGQCLENLPYYERFASCYSLFVKDPEGDAQRELRWLQRAFGGRRVTSVLDAGCGSGRHAVPLALAGFDVTAVDPCNAMLEQATERAGDVGAHISFLKASFDELPSLLHARYDAVIVLGNSLCNVSSLRSVRDALSGIRAVCSPHTRVFIGIKDFQRILKSRRRFWFRRAEVLNGAHTILFEVWNYDDPVLICTAVALTRRVETGQWAAETGQTREYMLLPQQLDRIAHEAGFATPRRLPHPTEARFLLMPV